MRRVKFTFAFHRLEHHVRKLLPVVCLVLVSAACRNTVFAEPQEKVFRAGAATSNITPPLGELVVGGWTPIPAKHIHD
ncbi:MAG TPA: hypothetical protein EYG03_29830, partial [Planctomycetes bacterium]|nr:hypothetical protein [Planctomycetota bacterium]